MRILVQGDKNRLKKHKRFKCTYCGCIFIADHTEYENKSNERVGAMFVARCPCCESADVTKCPYLKVIKEEK